MKSLKVSFPNQAGITLAGNLELPEDEQPLAYAVFAHCFTCTRQNTAATNIARALSRQRIAVLRFDFTGLGNSNGDFSATTFSDNVEDLLAAAQFLASEYQAPQILIGHSLGGAAVLHAAAKMHTVAAVATIAAPYHPRHTLKLFEDSRQEIETNGQATVKIDGRPFTIRKDFLEDLKEHDPKDVIGRLKAALLIMHSPRDMIVAIDNAAQIYQAAKHPKNFISLDPADHLLTRKEDSRYAAEMIATWARRYLETREEDAEFPEVIDNRVTVRTPAGGFKTDMFVNGHALVADEPVSYGGTNRGPSPYDYLPAALGACTGMTIQMYAGRKKWPLDAAVVRLTHAKVHAKDCADCEDNGKKIDRFEREVELIGQLTEEQRGKLLEIAEKCPVHRTLHEEVIIHSKLREEA